MTNDKVQSQEEASKDDRDCFYFGCIVLTACVSEIRRL